MSGTTRRLPQWKRRQRILLLLGGGFFFAILLPIAVTKGSVAYFERQADEALRARGFPATRAEARDAPSDVPLLEKALPGCLSAMRSLSTVEYEKSCAPDVYDFYRDHGGEMLSDDLRRKFLIYLHDHAFIVEQLHQAINAGRCRFSANWNDEDGINWRGALRAARLLSCEARIAAEEENAPRAMEAIQAGLALGSFFSGESNCIAFSCRNGVNDVLTGAFRQLLRQISFSSDQCAALQKAFNGAQAPAALTHALVGMRISALFYYDETARFVSEYGIERPVFESIPGGTASVVRIANAFGWSIFDRLRAKQVMNKLIFDSQRPPEEMFRIVNQCRDELSEKKSLVPRVSEVALPSVTLLVEAFLYDLSRLRMAETAAAIERYRIENNGRLPNALTDLVPVATSAVPDDPWDGAPLRYKPLENGYMLYSVSENLVDDGGIRSAKSAGRGEDGDFVFQVEHEKRDE